MDHQELTPEETDIRNQEMIQDLRRLYTAADETPSLARVRERLLTADRDATASTMLLQASTQGIQQGELQPKETAARFSTLGNAKLFRYLNVIAAVVIAALLVGSLVLVLTHINQSTTVASSPSTMPAPAPFPRSWEALKTFYGTGSKTIKNQHIVFVQTLGILFTCNGTGKSQVRLNDGEHGQGFSADCHNNSTDHIHVIAAPYTVDQIGIVVDHDTSWQLQLVQCVNAHACNAQTEPIVLPTPMPATNHHSDTPVSTQLPTPHPANITVPPSGTPMPMPTPNTRPASMPTPTPQPRTMPAPLPTSPSQQNPVPMPRPAPTPA